MSLNSDLCGMIAIGVVVSKSDLSNHQVSMRRGIQCVKAAPKNNETAIRLPVVGSTAN